MNTDTIKDYKRRRRENPYMPAQDCLRWAKHPTGRQMVDMWDEGSDLDSGLITEIDGFTVTLQAEDYSIYPMEDDGLGHYVNGCSTNYDYDWGGNYPRPAEELPLRLPYTSFASSAYNQDQHTWTYFIPEYVEDQHDYYRRCGASKSVAWDLTKQWVEDTIRNYFGAPLTYCTLTIIVTKEGIELGHSAIGTSYIDNRDSTYDLLSVVDETDLIGEALDDAKDTLKRLLEPTA